tara:strand:+ start:558 stop:1424 length:867 start_codon:yes stop_codon:yes gene_type:complete
MKISKDQLNNMIKEELSAALANEGILDKIKGAFSRDKPKADGVVGTSAIADTTPIDIKGPSRYSTDRVGIFSQGLGGQAKAADKDAMSNIGTDMGEKPEGVIGGGGPTPTAFTKGLSQDEQSKLAAMGLNVAAGTEKGGASAPKAKRKFGGNKPKAGQEAGIAGKAQARKARLAAKGADPAPVVEPNKAKQDPEYFYSGAGEKGPKKVGAVFGGRRGDPFQYKEVSPGKYVTRKGTKGEWKDVKNAKAIASIKKVQTGGESDWKAKGAQNENKLNEDKTFDRWKELIK